MVGRAGLRVYLDEDVDVVLARLLTVHGLDCQTAVQQGHLGWSDEAHLHYATQDSRIIVTHNRKDFETLAMAWWKKQHEHAGIVLTIRRADAYDLLRHLLPVLSLYDQSGWRNSVLFA